MARISPDSQNFQPQTLHEDRQEVTNLQDLATLVVKITSQEIEKLNEQQKQTLQKEIVNLKLTINSFNNDPSMDSSTKSNLASLVSYANNPTDENFSILIDSNSQLVNLSDSLSNRGIVLDNAAITAWQTSCRSNQFLSTPGQVLIASRDSAKPAHKDTLESLATSVSAPPVDDASFKDYMKGVNQSVRKIFNEIKSIATKVQKDLLDYQSALPDSEWEEYKNIQQYLSSYSSKSEVLENIKGDLLTYNNLLSSYKNEITSLQNAIKNRTKSDITDDLSENNLKLQTTDQDPCGYDLEPFNEMLKNIEGFQDILKLNDQNPSTYLNSDKFKDQVTFLIEATDTVFSAFPATSETSVQDILMKNFLAECATCKQSLIDMVTGLHGDLQAINRDSDLWGNRENILKTLVQGNVPSQIDNSIQGNGTFRQQLDAFENRLKSVNYPDQSAFFQNVRGVAQNLFNVTDDLYFKGDREQQYQALIDAINALPSTPLSFQESTVMQTKTTLASTMNDIKNNIDNIKKNFSDYVKMKQDAIEIKEAPAINHNTIANLLYGQIIKEMNLLNASTSKLKNLILDLKASIINRTDNDISSILQSTKLNISKSNGSIGYDLSALDLLVQNAEDFQEHMNAFFGDLYTAEKKLYPKDFNNLDENAKNNLKQLQDFLNRLDEINKNNNDSLEQINTDINKIFT